MLLSYSAINNFYFYWLIDCLKTEFPTREHLLMDFVQDQSDENMVQLNFIKTVILIEQKISIDKTT